MDILIIIGVVIFLIIVFKTPSTGSGTKRRRRYTNRNTKNCHGSTPEEKDADAPPLFLWGRSYNGDIMQKELKVQDFQLFLSQSG